ncbi:5-carboxymethyl-2-hydroxymuconate Delta-isomerase [Zooshikella harenae]|uniref:5-carboxymethyl-2-hydroxymuconate Delta-isomerase n=1 Tax=Zooshikella harenae TaxID=2827238 RepID=A0ABS5ZL24_9GAMM|nr:hypothetical protein [Zooshikella harenae]MBU2713772.1 hypothetical protein [Zooshikella harenae]
MPHCILEYSNNQVDSLNFRILFEDLHNALMKAWKFKKEDFKSRVIKHDIYYIGNGAKENIFISLSLQVMSGKNEEEKKYISQTALNILKKHFFRSLAESETSLSVQIVEVDKSSYSKIQSG